MGLRNMPYGRAIDLAEAVACRPGQVSSMALTTLGSTCDITLLAFAEGESVSEESYSADVLYLAVEGTPELALPDRRVSLAPGQAAAVAAGTLHAVEGAGAFKVLQIAVG